VEPAVSALTEAVLRGQFVLPMPAPEQQPTNEYG